MSAETSERRIVVAGPGAGKTTTSVALIQEIGSRDTNADRVVLFVSFSRAAMRAAFDAFGDSLADLPVDVLAMTLDSLAWQLTEETAGDGEPDFEDVVRRAADKLQNDYDGDLDDAVHLIVDEAQDLSAPRRRLLAAVVDRLPDDAGVTVFGDPLQSIYEFFEDDSDGVSAWQDLVDDLHERGIERTYHLDQDHRARRRGPKRIAQASKSLRQLTDPSLTADELAELLTSFSRMSVDEFVSRASEWKGPTAVLARTNAEVAALFTTLVDHGLNCGWREPGRAGPAVAGWVAELWHHSKGRNVSRDDFIAFTADRDGVDDRWFRLLLGEAESRGHVDWEGFARSLRASRDPMKPWFAESAAAVTVSTIHQAKGLEWDNVAVASADNLAMALGARAAEPELLFVALSRARDRVVLLDWQQPYTRRTKGLIYRPHPRSGSPLTVRLTPDALMSDRPIGGGEGQRALENADKNSLVEFELLASGHAGWPTYRCLVDGQSVGMTSPKFGQTFAELLRSGQHRWPSLGPVPMDGVETRWSKADRIEFWLQPRPFGMADVKYEKG
ncbi:AAA family ATPase [Gordonia terrae]|uniref:AAA family ATPase n=1 Tax=Gordonia terrae TaxID=2055 RepID=UPI00200B484C|nr:AAA family ATPase [Gordonia terrae]UPW11572.1 AAA family ATPase [Gordonia terrae]